MTTYASFKPSVQFLEAGEKGQQFANAANTFKPLLPQEARQSIEGIDKVSQAFTATGRALEHFGFDEAEPESTAFQQLQFAPHSMIEELPSVPALPLLDDPEVQKIIESLGGPIEEVPESTVFQSVINELPPSFFVGAVPAPKVIKPGSPEHQHMTQVIKQAGFDEAEPEVFTTESDVDLILTDQPVIIDRMNFTPPILLPENVLRPSTSVIVAGEHLKGNGWENLGKGVQAAGQVMRAFGFDEAEPELDQADSIAGETTTTESVGRMYSSATFTGGTGTSESWYNGQKVSDQLASVDEAVAETFTPSTQILEAAEEYYFHPMMEYRIITPEDPDYQVFNEAHQIKHEPSSGQSGFTFTPETLAPIDFNSSVVTDAYQQQKDPGADLIGGQTNQRTDSYQAQENQYAVLA